MDYIDKYSISVCTKKQITAQEVYDMIFSDYPPLVRLLFNIRNKIVNECPHVPKLAKFKPPRCPIGVYWNTLCLMRDVWTIKTYMI